MKTACILAAAVAATASATELKTLYLRGADEIGAPSRPTADQFSNYVVMNGQVDDNHCEELWIPKDHMKTFWAMDSWKYPTYSNGLCAAPYTTDDANTKDADDTSVLHVKRGVGATDASMSLTQCGGSLTWTAGAATKGGSCTITGKGSVSATSGTFAITAKYGIISLVDASKNPLGQTFSQEIKVLGNSFGTVKVNPFSVPASGDVTFTVDMPVPNIDGTVTGQIVIMSSIGQNLGCVTMSLAL